MDPKTKLCNSKVTEDSLRVLSTSLGCRTHPRSRKRRNWFCPFQTLNSPHSSSAWPKLNRYGFRLADSSIIIPFQKIFKEDIEEPKASRLFKFFGGRIKICISNNRNFSASSEKLPSPQESRPPTLPSQSEAVLPSVARLLSGGSKTMGSLNKLPSGVKFI